MDIGVAYLILILFIEVVVATTIEKANQLLAQNRLPEALEAYSAVISKDAKYVRDYLLSQFRLFFKILFDLKV